MSDSVRADFDKWLTYSMSPEQQGDPRPIFLRMLANPDTRDEDLLFRLRLEMRDHFGPFLRAGILQRIPAYSDIQY